MSEIKIKCPSCGKILRLADSPTINSATFTCPVCKEKHQVGQCERVIDRPKQQIENEETQFEYGGAMPSSDITKPISSQAIGMIVDAFGKTYQLAAGINTIGRKATTSTATVQIDVQDHYMSRTHSVIEVREAGGQMIHILKNGSNKNPSYLNGTELCSTDQFILNNGDRIKMGMTEVTFKK